MATDEEKKVKALKARVKTTRELIERELSPASVETLRDGTDYVFIVDEDRWLKVTWEYLAEPSSNVIDDVRKALKRYRPEDRTKRLLLDTKGLHDDP